LCNTIGILGTVASIFSVDRFGRRISLYFGFIVQGATLFLSAGLGRLGELRPDQAGAYGAAAAAMVFIYTFVFAQTVLMLAFIYPTEIWPQEIRAFGNSYGVFGWAIGCGVTTLVIPSMFASLEWKTLIVFASFNFASVPLVYFFFPETNARTLEEINLLFAAKSPFVKANEEQFALMLNEAGGNVAVAERKLMDEVNEIAGERPTSIDEESQVEGKIEMS
jgi:magnesium-transporting ATPase (P-type)